ncbi:AAEL017361-PA [Aedes aegypti]|uniref:Odorant receptor n=2 Tax=Aedes aegypti TaxID=7159 RepID=A0A1S7UF40_AEDAE|nr:AAEL017361-PA [Aedes aegypti]DAA80443.1 TPA_exp: odorant receptor 115 [Aedes aegypti]
MNCVRKWWSSLVAKKRYFWSNKGPGSDCFLWQDVLLLIGGIQSELTLKWNCERYIRFLVSCLFFLQSFFIFVVLCSTLQTNRDEMFKVVVEVLKFSAFLVAGCKLLLIKLHRKSITNIRTYINDGQTTTGDNSYDRLELTNFKQRSMTMIRFIYGLIFIDMALLSIPNDITDMAFDIRSDIQPFMSHARNIYRLLFITLLPVGFLPKFFSSMATVGTLLLGMQANFKVLANRFHSILSQPFVINGTDWEMINHELKDTVKHHLEFWRHFKALKSLVGETFFLVHYFSIMSIGALCYICQDIGVNFLSFVVLATLAMFLVEYYMFCHFVDSFQDIANCIGEHIFQIAILMPHNRKNHSHYIGFRTALMIIWLNTRRGVSMDCMGLFNISTVAFLHVLNIAYTVLTFLIQMSQL